MRIARDEDWYRYYLEKRAKRAEAEYKEATELLSVFNMVMDQDDSEDESITMRVKKQYIAMRSIRAVGEWAFNTIPGFSTAKTSGQQRAREIILEEDCGDERIEWAVKTIFNTNDYYANKYGNR